LYLQSPQEYIDRFGVVERPFIDRRYTDDQSLLEASAALLEGLQEPYEEYKADITMLGEDELHTPRIGKLIDVAGFKRTWITELWPEPIPWNLTNYNNGLGTMTTPFLTSNANAFINSLQASVPNGTGASPPTTNVDYRSGGILSQIPLEVRNVISPKEALMGVRHSASILLTDDNTWGWRVMGELWLPSEVEVYGCRQWGSNASPGSGFGSGGYVQYPIFAQNMKRVKVIAGTDTRSYWWLVTPRGGASNSAAVVSLNGTAAMSLNLTNVAGATATRTPICFRVT